MSKKTQANKTTKNKESKIQDSKTQGDFAFPREWELYAGMPPDPAFACLSDVPSALKIAGKSLKPKIGVFADNRLDLGALLGGKGDGKTAYVLAVLETKKATEASFGAGADWWMKWWVNGEVVCDTMAAGNGNWPPSPADHRFTARLQAGKNLVAVKVVSGSGTFALAADVRGDCGFPSDWRVFGPVVPDLGEAELDDILADPARARRRLTRLYGPPLKAAFDARNRLDVQALLGPVMNAVLLGVCAVARDMEAAFGTAGRESEFWVNGRKVFHNASAGLLRYRPGITRRRFTARLKAGKNLLAIRAQRKAGDFSLLCLELGGSAELRAEEQKQRVWHQTIAAMTDKRDAAPAGEIVYVNPNPPEVPLKPYTGERYRDRVPDTFDVAERAALCINALTGATNPLADHELYFHVDFSRNPMVMQHEISDVCQTKFMEALPLLRIASGSRLRLEVDEVWRQVTLKSIGPDGLFYVPLAGRPWGREPAHWVQKIARADGTLSNLSDPAVTQFSYAVVCGRMMNAMIAHHLREEHPFWADAIRKMIARLSELAIEEDGFCFLPAVALVPHARYDKKAMARPGSNAVEAEFFVRLLHGLGWFHRLTGDGQARELGEKLSRFTLEHWPFFAANGAFLNGDLHFHGHTLVLLNLLEMAMTTGNRDTIDFVRRGYEWAKTPAAGASDTIGFFPEFAHPNYAHCESCEIADMIGLALKLSKVGVRDYYNDAERWIRNHFAESQLMDYQALEQQAARQPAKPVGENETAWHVAERNVGAFAGWSAANDWFWGRSIQHCCTGNAARTLYWIWIEALRFQDGELRVNLLLNRASREADVYSFIPYQGKVAIKVKETCKAIYIHAPGWVKTGSPKMKATVDGKAVKTRWEGRYLVLDSAQPGQRIEATFPIAERTVKETIGGADYTLVIKGDTVVQIDPPGRNLPIYRRDHYRSGEPRSIEVERFLSDTVVEC